MIDTRKIRTLIRIGLEETLESPDAVALLEEIRQVGYINLLVSHEWSSVAECMTVDDLGALIKGLTLAESASFGEWGSISVSPVISTYRVFERRADAGLLGVTTDWILRRTRNYYVPFGCNNMGAKSLEDYHELCRLEQELKRIRQEQHRPKEEEEQRAASIRRQARSLASKEHTAKAGQRRGERNRLVAELAALDPSSRWQRIAEANSPLGFYPVEWADETEGVLRSLPVGVRLALLKRLEGRRSGPWRLLLDRLQALESGRT